MRADWDFVSYENTVCSFTNPQPDGPMMPGLGFNKRPDTRSWLATRKLLDEPFAG